jgi:hypothetical protein
MSLGVHHPQFCQNGLLPLHALYEGVKDQHELDAADGEAHGDGVHVVQALVAELDHQRLFYLAGIDPAIEEA